ncbi:MAG: diaminopimelate epimerase [Elusimicrobia bacterium RIFCSPLOWO2_12_FULL_59_9]|nr:MAG: diaminopimelate epimerase [Elusimicrobia bacterium RIFCSPLOWO2_12_FULL_59_9]
MLFWKLSGAGNDFILIEAGAAPGAWPRLARRLCQRGTSVGADGLLVVRRAAKGRPARLRYFNADGSAAFCGNGSRAAAWWMYRRGWVKKLFSFETDRGVLEAEIVRDGVARVKMPAARILRTSIALRAGGKTFTAHALHTGVPHVVVPVREVESVDVQTLGRAIRRHPLFRPEGANVNFIAFNEAPARLRTYERGVEAETLACGTGVTACAVLAVALELAGFPFQVRVRSGDVLSVDCRAGLPVAPWAKGGARRVVPGAVFDQLWLEGPAKIVYTGEIK